MEEYYFFSDFKQAAMQYFMQCPDRLLLPMTDIMFTHSFIAGCCPVCEAALNTGHIPMVWSGSSLCLDCHKELIEDKMGDPLCLTCQDYLDEEKLNMQFDNHKDIRTHIHEGECLYRFVIIHLFARNDRDIQRFVIQMYGVQTLYQPQHQSIRDFYPIKKENWKDYLPKYIFDEMNGLSGNGVMDAEYQEVYPQQIQPQGALPQAVKALPKPRKFLPNLMRFLR